MNGAERGHGFRDRSSDGILVRDVDALEDRAAAEFTRDCLSRGFIEIEYGDSAARRGDRLRDRPTDPGSAAGNYSTCSSNLHTPWLLRFFVVRLRGYILDTCSAFSNALF
jgi:hypothetical protein